MDDYTPEEFAEFQAWRAAKQAANLAGIAPTQSTTQIANQSPGDPPIDPALLQPLQQPPQQSPQSSPEPLIDTDNDNNSDMLVTPRQSEHEDQQPNQLLPPPTDRIYSSLNELFDTIQAWAIPQDYAVVKKRSDIDRQRLTIRCDRGSKYRHKIIDNVRKRNNHQLYLDKCLFLCKSSCRDSVFSIIVRHTEYNHKPLLAVIIPSACKRAYKAANIKSYIDS